MHVYMYIVSSSNTQSLCNRCYTKLERVQEKRTKTPYTNGCSKKKAPLRFTMTDSETRLRVPLSSCTNNVGPPVCGRDDLP
ncbi:hypothetical protein CEXT_335141 [Caerostris extrusa]|uniref:Uncharacterized protein n=1 Tax=Caerostris extrusa TaxID=172846 RepID=A0AAV4NLK0_CAEEX|nr:hypothetical protein CEXT_335141 [Caerostris extrusa]